MTPVMMQMLLKSFGVNAEDVEKQISTFANNAKIACEAMIRIEQKLDLLLKEKGINYATSIDQPKQLTNGTAKPN